MGYSYQEYCEALKVVKIYEQELLNIKTKCHYTKDDIIKNECKYIHYKAFAFWVTDKKEIPERDYDGLIIEKDVDFFTIEGNRSVYPTYEAAYKALIAKFKRTKLIK